MRAVRVQTDKFFLIGRRGGGTPVAEARLQQDDKTFRYMLVASEDRFGHRVECCYVKDEVAGYPLLKEIRYLFVAGEPHYRLELDYRTAKVP